MYIYKVTFRMSVSQSCRGGGREDLGKQTAEWELKGVANMQLKGTRRYNILYCMCFHDISTHNLNIAFSPYNFLFLLKPLVNPNSL